MIDIEAIKVREQAATPGPWETCKHSGRWAVFGYSKTSARDEKLTVMLPRKADAEFIAHARQDIPVLLSEIERLTREAKK